MKITSIRRTVDILLVLVCLFCVSPLRALAESATVAFRDIPNRFQLAGAQEDPPAQTDYTHVSADELGRILRSGQHLQRRVDAVRRLHDLSNAKSSKDRDYIVFMDTLMQNVEWLFTDEGAVRFRRYGIFMLFSMAYSNTTSSLPYHPKDPQEWALWKRVESLRHRGLTDQDPVLVEYFERYVPLARDPDWTADADRLRSATKKLAEALPQYDAALREALHRFESIQASQLHVKESLDSSTGEGLPPSDRAQFVRAVDQEIGYRLHTAWANLYAATVIQIVGQEHALRFGVTVAEAKLGWPVRTPLTRRP